MKIDCLSDLHGHYPDLEGGDLLIVAGDLTARDLPKQYIDFIDWIVNQDYKCKVVIAGNHDNILQRQLETDDDIFHANRHDQYYDFQYLCDSGTEFEGLKIWGTPWTTTFEGMNPLCKAFTVDNEDQIADKFAHIPLNTDILITHSPPFGIFDQVQDRFSIKRCGSLYLYGLLKYAIRPKLHVFGHIHEGYGKSEIFHKCISVNASHVDEGYQPRNKPIRIEL